MNTLTYSLVNHSNISAEQIKKIIDLKKQHWNYSEDEHLKWISQNINNNDYHLMVYNNVNNEILAYLNLVEVFITFDESSPISYLGIGNVCVNKFLNRNGLGLLLMQITNFLLKQLNKEGCLICKPHLHNFYSKSNWIKFESDLYLNGLKVSNAGIYFSKKISSKTLTLSKNF